MIGVFDSGLGGLTVLKHFLKDLPQYDYIYLGDNARVPYGEKSRETIYEYVKEAVDFLFAQKCEIIILACNSASAEALRKIQQEYLPNKYPGKKVLGVIRPLAEKFATNKKFKKIGVIGTNATIASEAYLTEIKKINPKALVYQQATPLLVPLIENGCAHEAETKIILQKYLKNFQTKKIDALILGCTHYPFVQKEIKAIMGKTCAIPDTGAVVATSLKDYLSRHTELKIKKSKSPRRLFYTTDDPVKFKKLGEKFLGQEIKNIKKIIL
jgi:glutamate racemase